MDDALSTVTKWLQTASSEVSHGYMQLPVAGEEELEYRERVYCYELYHRWRCHWDKSFPYSLGAEVDKSGHPLIRGDHKPDFLVHIPGRMVNLLVLEVKPSNASVSRMVKDLVKLTTFRRELKNENNEPANYFAAYFWIYNISVNKWPSLRGKIVTSVGNRSDIDLSLISCFVHEASKNAAIQVSWQAA